MAMRQIIKTRGLPLVWFVFVAEAAEIIRGYVALLFFLVLAGYCIAMPIECFQKIFIITPDSFERFGKAYAMVFWIFHAFV